MQRGVGPICDLGPTGEASPESRVGGGVKTIRAQFERLSVNETGRRVEAFVRRGAFEVRWRLIWSALVLTVCLFPALVGCSGLHTQIPVSPCTTVTHVSGDHVLLPGAIVISHDNDLPFSQTEIIAEHQDGSRTSTVYTNSVPNIWRVVGAGVLGTIAVTTLALYVGGGFDPSQEDDASQTIGYGLVIVVSTLVAAVTVLGGWHPPEAMAVEGSCREVSLTPPESTPALGGLSPTVPQTERLASARDR